MRYLLLIFLLLSLVLNAKDIKRQQVLMGTFASITLDEKNKEELQKGFKLLKKIENSLSSYKSLSSSKKESLLYRLNQNKDINADRYLLEALKQSLFYYKETNGYFDITIGSVTKKLYHFGEDEALPSQIFLSKAKIDIKSIQIDEKNIKIDENTTLDLGGMGKGFAIDKVAEYYKEQNISHGVIALSGDIRLLHPTTVYINSPFSNEPFAKLLTLHPNTSVSTSGTYRRYVKNKKYHHLINPKTKEQGKSFVSITLVTKQDNSLIDAMATAIGVMPEKEALHFLLNHPHIAYILVRPNGNVLYGNIEHLVKLFWL